MSEQPVDTSFVWAGLSVGQRLFYAVNIGRNIVTICCLISSVYELCLGGGSVTSVLFMRSKLAHYSIYFIVFIVFFHNEVKLAIGALFWKLYNLWKVMFRFLLLFIFSFCCVI